MVISCTDHVFQLPLASPTLKPATTTNTYLIKSQKQVMIVDPGYDHPNNTKAILQTIQDLGNPTVAGIIFTHYHNDHIPGVRGLMRHFDCPIYCHELEQLNVDRAIAPLQCTNLLNHGDILTVGNLNIAVYHTPGHTIGHIALYVTPDQILLTGDTVISEGSTWIGPPDGHMKTYLETLENLKAMPAKLIGPGHGPLICEPLKAIQWFISRRIEREQQILAILKQHNTIRVGDIVDKIYKNQVHPDIIWVAEKTTLAHLIKLVEDHAAEEIPIHTEVHDVDRIFAYKRHPLIV